MNNVVEIDGRRIAYHAGKIMITESMSILWVIYNHAHDHTGQIVFERKSSINTWVPATWHQFYAEARALARGLLALGVEPNDRIAIVGHSRYEFAFFDQATWAVGAQLIPICETDSTDQARWIVKDSQCRMAIAEIPQVRDVLAPLLSELDHFETIHVVEENAVGKILAKDSLALDPEIGRRIDAVTADGLATIIYTSSTTSLPKGTRPTHRNLLHMAINDPLDDDLSRVISEIQRNLLALPIAHVFARFICLISMYSGNVTGFAPDAKNLISDVRSFRPTYIPAVPQIFEKICNAADAKAGRGLKLKLFRCFTKVAVEYSRALDKPGGSSLALKAERHLGERLVCSSIRSILGGSLRNSISGGAPLGAHLDHFSRGVGINIYGGYGLTETSAPTSVNTPHFIQIGSADPAYPGCYVFVNDDSEILGKSDHIFVGYNNNPEAAAAAFTGNGQFRTGDLGEIDDDGFIFITGRKKELIVTAGGKNVAPAVLEGRLQGHPLISQIVIVGGRKPLIGALVVLDSEMLPGWLRNHGLSGMSVSETFEDPQILAAIDGTIKRANDSISRAESIHKSRILPIGLVVTNGYVTPSMKIKRASVIQDFNKEIKRIYATSQWENSSAIRSWWRTTSETMKRRSFSAKTGSSPASAINFHKRRICRSSHSGSEGSIEFTILSLPTCCVQRRRSARMWMRATSRLSIVR